MEKIKMTKKEQALLDKLDEFINKWHDWKETELPPEIVLYRHDGKMFLDICGKIEKGMLAGHVNPWDKTYRNVPIRCQY